MEFVFIASSPRLADLRRDEWKRGNARYNNKRPFRPRAVALKWRVQAIRRPLHSSSRARLAGLLLRRRRGELERWKETKLRSPPIEAAITSHCWTRFHDPHEISVFFTTSIQDSPCLHNFLSLLGRFSSLVKRYKGRLYSSFSYTDFTASRPVALFKPKILLSSKAFMFEHWN